MAKQFLSVIFSRSPLRAVDPVFCTNRRNYPREKIAKNATLSPFSHCSGLFLSPRFLFILSSVPPLRKGIRIMIHHFAGIPARLVTHRLLVQILQTPDTKATVMTLAKNVDDMKITFVFTRCWLLPDNFDDRASHHFEWLTMKQPTLFQILYESKMALNVKVWR